MSRCKVCFKLSKNNSFTSFFRFPSNPDLCVIWAQSCDLLLEYIQVGPEYFSKHYRLCSDHFDESSIYWNGKSKRLISDAVPTHGLATLPASRSPEQTNKLICPPTTTSPINSNELSHKMPSSSITHSGGSLFDSFNSQMIEHLCRLCGEEHHILTRIFGERGKRLDLSSKIKYLPVKIDENDKMISKICRSCLKKLLDTSEFFDKCRIAEEKFKVLLNAEDDEEHEPGIIQLNAINGEKLTSDLISSYKTLDVDIARREAQRSFTDDQLIVVWNSHVLTHDYRSLLPGSTTTTTYETVSSVSSSSKSQKLFYCNFCSKRFSTDRLLKLHARAHALEMDDEGNFVCDHCGYISQNRFTLNRHMQRHFNERPYKCLNCTASFYNLSVWKQHNRSHKRKQFICDKCSKSFLRKEKLINHLRKHCDNTAHPNSKMASKLKKTKQFSTIIAPNILCAKCGIQLTRMDSLSKHMRIHTGERPFFCFICGFAFKQKGDCKKHEDNHKSSAVSEKLGNTVEN